MLLELQWSWSPLEWKTASMQAVSEVRLRTLACPWHVGTNGRTTMKRPSPPTAKQDDQRWTLLSLEPNRRNNWPGAKYLKLFRYLPITKVLLGTSWPGAKYLKQTCMQKGVDAKQCRQLKVQPDLGRAIGHALLYIDFLTVREALPRIPDCSN